MPVGEVRHALRLHLGRAVAGDIADVIALPDGHVAALLGDVSGAGLDASLVMASVQSFLRVELGHHSDLARALTRLNRHLHGHASHGHFVTLWLGIFKPATRACRFVDAGHGYLLRLRDGGDAEPVSTHGNIPQLAIEPDTAFNAETPDLAIDEFILLYSDRLIEQRAPDGTPFGRDRLIAAVRGAKTVHDAVANALTHLHRHAANAPPDDDTILLALGWPKSSAAG